MGHPQELRLNFEVTYPSGIILTEAPSIVEITDTSARVGHPPGLHGGLKINKFHYIEDNTYTYVAGFCCKKSQ